MSSVDWNTFVCVRDWIIKIYEWTHKEHKNTNNNKNFEADTNRENLFAI